MSIATIRIRAFLFVVFSISVFVSSNAQATSITVLPSGILTGASDVTVNGKPYDVTFVDGSCADVLGICDAAHLTFTTQSDALAASSALLDQVLIDGALGNFDSRPELTNGCTWNLNCYMVTPYQFNPSGLLMYALANNNSPAQSADYFNAGGPLGSGYNSSNDVNVVFAKWTPRVPQSVPEHTDTILLLGLSVAITLAMRRAV